MDDIVLHRNYIILCLSKTVRSKSIALWREMEIFSQS